MSFLLPSHPSPYRSPTPPCTALAVQCKHSGRIYTFTPMFTTVASRRSKTREVTPSPRSLASQQLQRNVYLVPRVGTAKLSSSTSQQLSGEAPSWPSYEGTQGAVRIWAPLGRKPSLPCSTSPSASPRSASFQCALDSLTQVPPLRGKDFTGIIKVSNQMTLS